MISSKLDANEKIQIDAKPLVGHTVVQSSFKCSNGASQPGTAHFLSHGEVLLETKICSRQKSVQAVWLSNRVRLQKRLKLL